MIKPISRILIAIDGSSFSIKAAKHAINIAKGFNSEIYMIHVLQPTAIFGYTSDPVLSFLPATGNTINDLIESSRKYIKDSFETIKAIAKENKIEISREEILLQITTIVGEIINYAEYNNIDLIVAGSKGKTGIKKMLLGSVASGLVTNAHCPVMVVR